MADEEGASESLTRTSAAALESLKANNADNQTAIARMAEESAASELTPPLRDKVRELFNKMDTDGDGAVSEADAIRFFKNDAKLNARAMLNEVRVRPAYVGVFFSSFPEPGSSRARGEQAGGRGVWRGVVACEGCASQRARLRNMRTSAVTGGHGP